MRARGVHKTVQRDPKRAIGYLRVSTEQQHLGPEAQRAAIQRWADEHGIEVVSFVEDRVSGSSPPHERDGMRQALQEITTLNAGVLLVAKRDRVARKATHTMSVEFTLERQGARLISVEDGDNVDPDNPMTRLLAMIRDVFAEVELLAIRSRVKAALHVKRERGEVIGAVPFGTQRDPTNPVKLAPCDEEQAVIDLVHRMAERGLPLRRIARALDRSQYRPRGGGRWHHHTISRILGRAADSVQVRRSDALGGHREGA